jgi:hypothetical protein
VSSRGANLWVTAVRVSHESDVVEHPTPGRRGAHLQHMGGRVPVIRVYLILEGEPGKVDRFLRVVRERTLQHITIRAWGQTWLSERVRLQRTEWHREVGHGVY